MDDFNHSILHESKHEWGIYLVNILTPLIVEGVFSIFDESIKLCLDNKEPDKYLLTFQNLLIRIPKWNGSIIEKECERITEKSKCTYLDELIACVHIIQLKILTAVRVSHTQKKMDIEIPKLDKFIHNVYINVAKKIYKNVYLFNTNVSKIQLQRYKRELEVLVQECILNTIRESIPIETILKVYVDEDTTETIEECVVTTPGNPPVVTTTSASDDIPQKSINNIVGGGTTATTTTIGESSKISTPDQSPTSLTFNDIDRAIDTNNSETTIVAPKTIDRLEQISTDRYNERKQEEEDDDANDKITISDIDTNIPIETLPLLSLSSSDDIMSDIEILS